MRYDDARPRLCLRGRQRTASRTNAATDQRSGRGASAGCRAHGRTRTGADRTPRDGAREWTMPARGEAEHGGKNNHDNKFFTHDEVPPIRSE